MLRENKLRTNTRRIQGGQQKSINAFCCRILRRQDSNPKASLKNSDNDTTHRSSGHQQNDVRSLTLLVAQAKQGHPNKMQLVHSLQNVR